MKEKFYKPEIEEFCVGFEYEEKNHKTDKYFHMKCYANDFDIEDIDNNIEVGNIRVKYLDQEDIESLGFKIRVNVYYIQDQKYQLDYLKAFDKWYIFEVVDEDDMVSLFAGKIKNKHELEVILKQIGVK